MYHVEPIRTLGILGAGRVGTALARLAGNAGLDVWVAGRDDPQPIATSDAVILAIPLPQYRTLPAEALDGKLVIDATNYWWESDGFLPEFTDLKTSTSETIQAFLASSRIVKSFNHASLWELENLPLPAGHPERRALAVAGDDAEDVVRTSSLVHAMGFDAVHAGTLAAGVKFEPSSEAFGADAKAPELREMLNRFWTSQRGLVVARARDMHAKE